MWVADTKSGNYLRLWISCGINLNIKLDLLHLIITSNSTEGDKPRKGNEGLEKIALLFDRTKVPHLGKAALALLLNQKIQLVKPRLNSMCAAVTYIAEELRNARD